MSYDWQEKLDQHFKQQQTKEKAAVEAERIRQDQARKRAEKAREIARIAEYSRIQAENKHLLHKHQRKYRCHIKGCKVVSIPDYPINGDSVPSYVWDIPVGLVKCSNCEQWVCTDKKRRHYSDTYRLCRNCGDRLSRPDGKLPMSKRQKIFIAKRVSIISGATVLGIGLLSFLIAFGALPDFRSVVITVVEVILSIIGACIVLLAIFGWFYQ